MTRHIIESELALYVSGDLAPLRRVIVRLHTNGCERCRGRVDAYRADGEKVREIAAEMPEGVNWDRLAAEMTANIRVGLAAGECVAPRTRKTAQIGWRPMTAMAGLAILLAGASWWLNMPASTTQSLGRAARALWQARGNSSALPAEERGMMVEATSSGIELRENGSTLGVSQGTAQPVAISVSVQGSASARYVDKDTGQMTITSVYVQ